MIKFINYKWFYLICKKEQINKNKMVIKKMLILKNKINKYNIK